jgi:hypothetical protein
MGWHGPKVITGAGGVMAHVGQDDAWTERSGPHHERGVNDLGVWPVVRMLCDEGFGDRTVVSACLVDVWEVAQVGMPGSISPSPTMSRT